ncbi:MAG TPA: DUF1441 family protein [Thiohalobacter sp.]|nr:DUF1441 family protein [Thiohalobacter sp.]
MADLREMEARERARELIPAEEAQAVIATAFSTIAQALRSLPDNLERRAGIGPKALEELELALDTEMATLADALASVAADKPADHRAALEWLRGALEQ